MDGWIYLFFLSFFFLCVKVERLLSKLGSTCIMTKISNL